MRKSNWIISPNRDEHKQYLKPPARKDMYTHEVGWLEDEMSFCKWFILFQGRTLIVVENGTGSEDNIERKNISCCISVFVSCI